MVHVTIASPLICYNSPFEKQCIYRWLYRTTHAIGYYIYNYVPLFSRVLQITVLRIWKIAVLISFDYCVHSIFRTSKVAWYCIFAGFMKLRITTRKHSRNSQKLMLHNPLTSTLPRKTPNVHQITETKIYQCGICEFTSK
jgi:hypothetical protein